MDLRNLPREERVCVNCENYQRRINVNSLFFFLFGDTSYFHRCILNGKKETLNTITGRVTIKIVDNACAETNGYSGDCHGENRFWKPSDKWKKKKENLFKILKT